MVRGSRGHLPPFSVLPLIGRQTGISSCRGGEKEGLEAKDYKKTGWHCDSLSLSLLTDSQLCVLVTRDLLLQGNKYFITIIWTQSCLLLSDDVC